MKKKDTLENNRNEKRGSPNKFPGQTHFPALSQPLSVHVFIILLAIAIAVCAIVWWLR
ncbi:MAG TPA: hypothetical protein VFS76_01885 [Pyrinomonadaceae bacterium]|nr:hypothetical protein [Pyrinomonadaceae bacterium]